MRSCRTSLSLTGVLLLQVAFTCAALAQAAGSGAAAPPPMMSPQMMAEIAALRKMPDTAGNGQFAAVYDTVPGKEMVVYRPSNLDAAAEQRKLGVYVWGNGGCQADATFARFHLLDIASHGYVAIAPGHIESGPRGPKDEHEGAMPAPPPMPPGKPGHPPVLPVAIHPTQMIAALDWILAENSRPGSPYFKKIDPHRVAVGGHSCGGLLAIRTALDPRVHAVIVEDSGVFPDNESPLPFVKKSDLNQLHTPILYITGGPTDIAQPNALADFEQIKNVTVMLADRPGTGHMGSFLKPGAEGTEIELKWMAWQLDGDQNAARMFVGDDCELCRNPAWQLHRKMVP